MDRESGRRRRRYSQEFKAELVATCSRPGVSIASIALANGMNANVLRRWLVEHRQTQSAAAEKGSSTALAEGHRGEPAFVPVELDDRTVLPPADIRVEVRRAATTVTVNWPTAAASDCAAWMRELLK
jgi:transposase-like protein